ncbi:MAG: nucleotide-binding protein [Gammaproteobacteria bacterium]|nr:nucleotide-binding protein [Gammaproteobacteria bacterium]
MTETYEELLAISSHMAQLAEHGHQPEIQEPLERLKQAAEEIGKAWSGSWLGHHANVYYNDLQPPPPGAHFSPEWGLDSVFGHGTSGDWLEFGANQVKDAIYDEAGNPDLESCQKLQKDLASRFDTEKSNTVSILEIATEGNSDAFLQGIKVELEKLSILTKSEVINKMKPSGKIMTRDSLALTQGFWTPPHFSVLSEIFVIQHTSETVSHLGILAKKAGSHLFRRQQRSLKVDVVGTNVFIGHGRSPIWRELKEFITERLKLPVDEFNRVPVAGVTNTQRLSEMMDAAAFAFLLMTGEDEQPDGQVRARMNVIHEAGLFQGRLGFTRAIVLLEDGCEEFSNIAGLGHIHFPRGNIRHATEEIRKVLEREGLLGNSQ